MDFLSRISDSSSLSESVIARIAKEFRDSDTHKLVASTHINVLILGKTGVGKSTFFNCLQDPTIPAFKQSVISQTKATNLQPFTLNIQNTNVTINLIDTPGLRESGGVYNRSDIQITQTIIDCIKRDITKIHVLLICVSTTERFTDDDFITINTLTKYFCGTGLPVLVCITKAEEKLQAWYEARIEEISSHQFFKELKQKTDFDICFSGYVDYVNSPICNEEQLSKRFRFVYAMRESLLNRIYHSYSKNNGGVQIHLLPYYKILEEEASKHILDFINILISYVNCAKTGSRIQGQQNYVNVKTNVLQYTLFYDISVMSSHFALINDLLSVLYNTHHVKEEWIYEGFNDNVYKKMGSLTLDFNTRLTNLPPTQFKVFAETKQLNLINH